MPQVFEESLFLFLDYLETVKKAIMEIVQEKPKKCLQNFAYVLPQIIWI